MGQGENFVNPVKESKPLEINFNDLSGINKDLSRNDIPSIDEATENNNVF